MSNSLNINSKEIDLNYIKSIIQNILDKTFEDPRKREIVVRPNELHVVEFNFACPICGDSHNRPNMKRGHLYLDRLFYCCYNERETDSMFFTKFCKQFNVQLDLEKKMEIYNYLDNNWKYTKKDDFILQNLDKLLDLEDFEKYINEKPTYLLKFRPIVKGSVQWNYLINRKIFNFTNIYEGVYKITDTWLEPVIVLLNRAGDKLLGMQIRNLKAEKTKRIYKFITFQELYNMRHPNDPLDEIESIPYNKMSAIFNFLNVDYDRPLYVFEGFLNSMFFPNSVALVGLDTDISLFSDQNVDIRFVLDNDEPGQRKAKKMIDQNHSVFLWKKLINDLSKGKSVKFKHYLEIEITDINRLVEAYDDQNIYTTLHLDKYFAKDQFDLIDM